MGGTQPSYRSNVVVIDDRDGSLTWFHRTSSLSSSLTFQHFSTMQAVFQSHGQQQLCYLLTTPNHKDEVIRFMAQHYLSNSRLYIWVSPGSDTGQEDFDNVYITMIDQDLAAIVKHITDNVQTDVYMPLLKMNRELQKKVNVKVVTTDPAQVWREELEPRGLSYEIFQSPELFDDSTLVSVSDFVVCNREVIGKVMLIAKIKFRKVNLIYHQLDPEDRPPQQALSYIAKSDINIRAIADFIANKQRKLGWRIQRIEKIYIINGEHSADKKEREKAIETIIQDYPHIRFIQINDQQELLSELKHNKYSAVLFLQTIDINNFKRLLVKYHLQYRVLILALPNISYAKKPTDFSKLELFYYIQTRKPKSVDWINKHIKSHHLDLHKKDLQMNEFEIRQYTSVEQYRNLIESGVEMSPVVLCTAKDVEQVEEFFLQTKPKAKIFCFDKRENVSNIRKKKIFNSSEYYWYSSSNIKEIIEEIKKLQLEYLVTNTVSVEEQMDAFYEARDKFRDLKKKSVRIKTSAFPDGHNCEKMYVKEVSFVLNKEKDKQITLERFLQKFIQLWKMKYNPIKDLDMLKSDLKDAFLFIYKCDILKVEDTDFQKHYLTAVDRCQTLSALAQTVIAIYSLPHGLSETLDRLLSQFQDNIKLIRIFGPLLFCLLLSYCNFFELRSMEKTTLKIYLAQIIDQSEFQPGDILHNTNFFGCINLDSYNESNRDYILVEYEFAPLSSYSFYSSLLFIEPYSFYKQSIEYLFAPYSTFEVIGTCQVKESTVLKLRNVSQTNLIKLFLEQTLESTSLYAFTKAMEDPNIAKTMVPANKLQEKWNSLYYQQFLEHMKKKMLLTAEHKLLQVEVKDTKDIMLKIIWKINLAWLYARQGRYSQAQTILQSITESTENTVKQTILCSLKAIEQIITKRNQILDLLPVEQPQSNPIRWQSTFVVQQQQFLFKRQDEKAGLMYQTTEVDLDFEQTEIKVQSIFMKYDLEQNRNMTNIWRGVFRKPESQKVRVLEKKNESKIRKSQSLNEPINQRFSHSIIRETDGNQQVILNKDNDFDYMTEETQSLLFPLKQPLPKLPESNQILPKIYETQDIQ